MRKISTHIGVYAILLIAALYGSLSIIQKGQTSPGSAVIMQKAITSAEGKKQRATQYYQLSKNDNCKASYSLSLLAPTVIPATAATGESFFTHSAIHPYYINTL